MEKKNEYVITIGFNNKLVEHRKVAGILNGMGRTKAQYIVNAVIAYEQEGLQSVQGNRNAVDYEQMKDFVRQAVDEYMEGREGRDVVMAEKKGKEAKTVKTLEEQKIEIAEDAWNGIMNSISAFRHE